MVKRKCRKCRRPSVAEKAQSGHAIECCNMIGRASLSDFYQSVRTVHGCVTKRRLRLGTLASTAASLDLRTSLFLFLFFFLL